MPVYSYDASNDSVTVGRDSPQPTNVVSEGNGQLSAVNYSTDRSVQVTTDPSNVMTSGRNHGMPVHASDWNDETVVEIRGMTMTAGVAVHAGLLSKDANGFRPLGEGGTSAAHPSDAQDHNPDDSEGQEQSNGIEALDDRSEGLLTDFVSKIPGTDIHVAADAMLDSLANGGDGELPESILGTLAGHLGREPHQVQGAMQHLRAAFEGQAVKAVEGMGVPDGAAFFAHLAHGSPAAYQTLVREHLMNGTTGQYAEAVTEYLVDLDKHDPAAALATVESAGLQGEFDSSGRLLIRNNRGQQLSWETFMRVGAQ